MALLLWPLVAFQFPARALSAWSLFPTGQYGPVTCAKVPEGAQRAGVAAHAGEFAAGCDDEAREGGRPTWGVREEACARDWPSGHVPDTSDLVEGDGRLGRGDEGALEVPIHCGETADTTRS